MAEVIGADFSHWDGMVNWEQFQASGASFAYVKAGQGVGVDPQWYRNAINMLERGIPGGAYWYVDPRVAPVSQAAKIIQTIGIGSGGLGLPLAFDYEAPDHWGGSYGGWRNLAAMIQEVLNRLPEQKVMVYSNYYYWMDHRPSPIWNLASYNWFKKFPLWLAQYNGLDHPTRIPGPWSTWLFHQYTAGGDPKKYGSQKLAVDLDRFNGTVEQLRTLAGMDTPPPPPPPPVPAYRGRVIASAGVKVRSGPSTSYPVAADTLPWATVVSADEQHVTSSAEKWLHLLSPVVGWSAQVYAGQVLIELL